MARPDARIEQLQKLMGHADISTTAVYLHQNATDLEAAVLAQHPARATLAADAERRRQRAWAALRSGIVNYPRRQQYRRLCRESQRRCGRSLAAGLAVLAAMLRVVLDCACPPAAGDRAGLLRAPLGAARPRSRVGARSEEQVERALAPLAAEGWRLRHSLPWQGRGDIDSLAIAPTGVAFAIETKTRTFDGQHLTGCTRWPSGCTPGVGAGAHGALPVLCVVHARQLERTEAA